MIDANPIHFWLNVIFSLGFLSVPFIGLYVLKRQAEIKDRLWNALKGRK